MSPRDKKPWKLIPEPVPARGARASMYDRIVAEFVASGEPSVRVELEGRKPASIRLSLKKAVERSGAKVALVARGSATYLKRL